MGKLTEIFGVSVVAVMAFIYSLSHIPGAVFSGLRYNSQTLGKLLGEGLSGRLADPCGSRSGECLKVCASRVLKNPELEKR